MGLTKNYMDYKSSYKKRLEKEEKPKEKYY